MANPTIALSGLQPQFGQNFLSGQAQGQDMAIKEAAVAQARQQADAAKRQEGLAPIVNAFRYIKAGTTPEDQGARLENVKKWALTQYPDAADKISGITVDLIEPIYASLTAPQDQLKEQKIGAEIGYVDAGTGLRGVQAAREGANIGNDALKAGSYAANNYSQIEDRGIDNAREELKLQATGFGQAPEGTIMTGPGTAAPIAGPDGKPIVQPKPVAGFSNGINVKGEGSLRAEFNKATQDFVTIGDAYQNVRTAAATPTAAGDLSLIFAYMKMLDPTSVVREGEFANAQNAAGVPDQIANMYNKIVSGERLNPDQRKDFTAQAERIYRNVESRAKKTEDRYRGLATDYGYEPGRIVSDRGAPAVGGAEAPAADEETSALLSKYGIQ
jgi:hypothetical protein